MVGDPSNRVLPVTSTEADVRIYHMHIDPRPALQDLNCLFPLARLRELEQEGLIGTATEHHFSMMGYILQPKELLHKTVPAMIHDLRAERADMVVLVPA